MPKFTDNAGDDWIVEVTVFHVERVKRDVEVNLNDAMVGLGKTETGKTDEDHDQNLITQLDGNPMLLVSVLYSLCEDQIKQRSLGPEDFAKRFAGDVLNSAFAALLEALLAFFRKPNERAALQAQIRLMKRAQEKLLERWKESEAKVNSLAELAIDAQVDRELAKLETRFGRATSTDSSIAPPAS
jgi:hypothetical protein